MCWATYASRSRSSSVYWAAAAVGLHDEHADGAPPALSGTPSQSSSGVDAPTTSISPSATRRSMSPWRSQLRLARAQHVGRRSRARSRRRRAPIVRIRDFVFDLVDVVGPAIALALVVIECDEEVRRVHQLADDPVHRAVEGGQVLGPSPPSRRRGRARARRRVPSLVSAISPSSCPTIRRISSAEARSWPPGFPSSRHSRERKHRGALGSPRAPEERTGGVEMR